MDESTNDILEAVNFIKERMATKDDLTDLKIKLDTDLTQLENKIDRLATKNDVTALERSISRELDDIKKQLANVTGFGKEIDHALERIAAIEKHLGIRPRLRST